jgi:hypothetical protein
VLQVGTTTYNNATVGVGSVVSVGPANAAININSLDTANNQVTMPLVIVGSRAYNNVVIGLGGITCSATQVPQNGVCVMPAPIINVAISQSKVSVGKPVTITWSSTNATSCVGLDAMSGAKAINNSEVITPTGGGQYTYTVSCDGAGGTAKQSVALIVPMPVLKSSYENKMAAGKVLGPQTMPTFSQVNGAYQSVTGGLAYGDFFQDGSYAMMAATNVFAGTNGNGSTVAGQIYFFHSDGKGEWVDQTDKLINAEDRTGCISPRKAIVADFNGDGKPDIFLACHGIDGKIPLGYTNGENPRYLLSQADGTYKNIDAGFRCFCHSAAAVDFNGNGYSDVIVGSPVILERIAYLKNNKNGTFTDTLGLVPASTNNKAIWTLEFVDVNNDGKYDLATAGSENSIPGTIAGSQSSDWQPTIFVNDGSNFYSDQRAIKIPMHPIYNSPLDIIVKDSKIALLSVNEFYTKAGVTIYSVINGAQLGEISISVGDAVWFTLFNGNVVNTFADSTYSIPF